MAAKRNQRGVSFITVIFIVGVLAAVGLLAAQAFPTFLEYQAALKAINKAKDSATIVEVRNSFDRAASVDSITSITGKDLEVTPGTNGTMVVSFAYNKEIHMFGPAYLLLKYTGSSRPGR